MLAMPTLQANLPVQHGIQVPIMMKSKAKSIAHKIALIPSTLDTKLLLSAKVLDP
jgi:hypothetical protein